MQNQLEVSLSALRHNANVLRKYVGSSNIFYLVVKSNAYGLGADR